MPSITPNSVAAAYSTAKRVLGGELSRAQALDELAARGMGRGSAGDYINTLRCMIDGRQYTRTLNSQATEFYLNSILSDYGEAIAWRAVQAVRSHVDYYDKLGHGRLASVRQICEEFASRLEVADGVEAERFEAAVNASRKLDPHQRAIALSRYPAKPLTVTTSTRVFRRNPHVVAAVLERSGGVCEMCLQPAPFMRSSNGEPYLEVHHKVMLANGGDDTVENATAVCPNCHRHAHFG